MSSSVQLCFQEAIENALLKHEEYKEKHANHIGRKSFVNEFLTYKIGFPRQSGHSTAIKSAIKLYPELRKSVIFVHNCGMIKQYQKDNQDALDSHNKNTIVLSYKVANDDKLRGIRVNSIFVDCACFTSNTEKERIIEHACNQPDLKILMFVQ